MVINSAFILIHFFVGRGVGVFLAHLIMIIINNYQ